MTLENVIATIGLSAEGTPVGEGLSGPTKIGSRPATVRRSDSTVAYTGAVIADSAGDVATLTLATGVAAQTTGTPEITGDLADGKDFEGETIAMTTLYDLLVVADPDNDGTVTLANAIPTAGSPILHAGDKELSSLAAGASVTGNPLVLTFSDAGDKVTVTVDGK